MPVERDDEREGVVLARVGDGLPDDLLVAEMHAVENADGQADLAAAGASSFAAWMIFMCHARGQFQERDDTLFPIPPPSISRRRPVGSHRPR